MDLHSLVVAVPEQVSTTIEGESIILNLKSGMYYGLKGVSARIWELVAHPTTPAAICDSIMAEYDVDQERCQKDVLAILQDFQKAGLIEAAPAQGDMFTGGNEVEHEVAA